MSLVEHAKKEFEIKGWLDLPDDDPQAWVVANVLELLEVFAKQGHSGTSAPYAINLFCNLAKFDILAPLTGEAGEWVDHGNGFYQNKRCSHVFKNANGEAWDIRGVVWKEGDRCFTDKHSYVPVTFPYKPTTVYKDVIENPDYETYKASE